MWKKWIYVHDWGQKIQGCCWKLSKDWKQINQLATKGKYWVIIQQWCLGNQGSAFHILAWCYQPWHGNRLRYDWPSDVPQIEER